ncbi:MAG: hypothetical protein KF802_03025 [Bdellovibrionaceae bacterium]|nr:hypothetical protein [Pseudobdellovibrionaceae bacterium]
MGIAGLLSAVLFAVTAGFQACSRVNLERIPNEVDNSLASKAEFCVSSSTGEIIVQNVIFVIDQSGSNVPHTRSGAQNPGSDPSKTFRYGAMNSVYELNKDNPYFRWGLVSFSGVEVKSLISDGQGPRMTQQGNTGEIAQALADFQSSQDLSGPLGTDYDSALATLQQLLLRDLNERKTVNDSKKYKDIYHIFFISDGIPEGEGGEKLITSAQDTRVLLVKDLASRKPGQITLHSAFYQAPPFYRRAEAIQGLKYMAGAGEGTFTDVSAGETLDLVKLITGERTTPRMVKGDRVQAYNLNAAFCMNGEIGLDSDMDGLCDEDEVAFNEKYKSALDSRYQGKRFDPFRRHSLNPSYSDAFVWRFDLFGNRAALPTCTLVKPDEDFDLLNSCEEAVLASTSPTGPTADWTNKMSSVYKKHLSPTNFDSDGDGFLDFHEFFQLLPSTNAESGPLDFQNIYQRPAAEIEMKDVLSLHRHPLRPLDSSHDYRVQFEFTGYNNIDEPCYRFRVNRVEQIATTRDYDGTADGMPQLSYKKGENVMLFYFISTAYDQPQSVGRLHYVYRKGVSGSNITLLPQDFTVFQSPEEEDDAP